MQAQRVNPPMRNPGIIEALYALERYARAFDAISDEQDAHNIAETLMPWIADLGWYLSGDFDCGIGRQGAREYDNFGPDYSICANSSSDPGGDGIRSGAELDIATEP